MNYGPVTGALATAMADQPMKYLDRRIADMVYNVCPPSSGCTLTATQENNLVAQVTNYLNANKNDPLIAGYYILDDWPGNVKNALQRITAAVRTITPTKPTVCAFVGILDFWQSSDHSGAPFTAHAAFDRAIANYSPAGCDIADFYVYGVPGVIPFTNPHCVPPSDVDWDGSGFYPYMKAALTARGWVPSMGWMISPQTFTSGNSCDNDYPEPTMASIELQTTSACQAGATSTLAYIYDQWGQGKYLANQISWRTGYANGLAACRNIWGT
jgi:hypothetical protein